MQQCVPFIRVAGAWLFSSHLLFLFCLIQSRFRPFASQYTRKSLRAFGFFAAASPRYNLISGGVFVEKRLKMKKGHSIQPPCVEQKCKICVIYFHTWCAKRGKVNVLLYCGCVEILEQGKTTEQAVPSHHNISKIASEIPCLIAGPW